MMPVDGLPRPKERPKCVVQVAKLPPLADSIIVPKCHRGVSVGATLCARVIFVVVMRADFDEESAIKSIRGGVLLFQRLFL